MNIKNRVEINNNVTKNNVGNLYNQILLDKYNLYIVNITLKIFENINNIDIGEYETLNPNFKLRIEEIDCFQLNSAQVKCTLYGYSTDFDGNRNQYYEITYILEFTYGVYSKIYLYQVGEIKNIDSYILLYYGYSSNEDANYFINYLESTLLSYAEDTIVDSFEFLEL